MSAIHHLRQSDQNNPLDEFEELLEASPYEFSRPTKTRLHFECSGKQGEYDLMLEWNEDAKIMKCSLIIDSTRQIRRDQLDKAIEIANESAWHGFFTLDGVGHSVFKTLINLANTPVQKQMFIIEDNIDRAVDEADRFLVSLALSNDNNSQLFPEEQLDLENLTLMFSDIKGNA